MISQSVLGANGWPPGELLFFPLGIGGILPSQKTRYIFLVEIRSILKIHYFREQKLLTDYMDRPKQAGRRGQQESHKVTATLHLGQKWGGLGCRTAL